MRKVASATRDVWQSRVRDAFIKHLKMTGEYEVEYDVFLRYNI